MDAGARPLFPHDRQVYRLKPFLRAWQEGVRAKALSEGVEAPAGLGRAWAEGRGVRAKALSEGVEAPAGLGRAWAEGMQVKVDPGCIILDLFSALHRHAKRRHQVMIF